MEIRVHANTEYELEKLLWGNGLSVFKFIATHIWAGEVTDIEALIKYADDLGYYDAYKVIREVINAGKAESLWKLVENYGNSLDELFEEIVCLDIDNL